MCEQGNAQKPDQGARGSDPRGADGRGAAPDGKSAADGRDQRRVPWWKAEDTRAELGISDKQSKDIDDIFQATLPSLRAAKDELDKLDEALGRLIKEGTADISVVAYDSHEWHDVFHPRLTTVTQPTYLMGTRAAQLLISRITGGRGGAPQQVLLQPALTVRESCDVYHTGPR
jgi:hypothetical protein